MKENSGSGASQPLLRKKRSTCLPMCMPEKPPTKSLEKYMGFVAVVRNSNNKYEKANESFHRSISCNHLIIWSFPFILKIFRIKLNFFHNIALIPYILLGIEIIVSSLHRIIVRPFLLNLFWTELWWASPWELFAASCSQNILLTHLSLNPILSSSYEQACKSTKNIAAVWTWLLYALCDVWYFLTLSPAHGAQARL